MSCRDGVCRGRGPGHQLRILVSGSRAWRDPEPIARGISGWLNSIGTCIGHAYPIPIIVHGRQRTWDPERRCWYGADWLAGECARTWGFTEEGHAADWDRYGRAAGPLRNRHMVGLGADACLGFPLGASPGTRNCMDLARAAGIPVIDHDPTLRSGDGR